MNDPILDHVVVNVHSALDEAVDQYTKLGFLITPRGHHSLGSSNNLSVFGDTYLELLGYLPGRQTLRPSLWVHPPGLSGLVFKLADPETVFEELRSKGLPVLDPLAFSRPVETPDGARDAAFTVVRIDGDIVQNGRTFFCQHHTPHLVWREEWQKHPNGALDVAGFVTVADNPRRSTDPYRAMFGDDAVYKCEGGFGLRAGSALIEWLTPGAASERFQDTAVPNADGGDRMVAIAIRTRSLDALPDLLSQQGVPFLRRPDQSIVVPYEYAAGTLLQFVP